MYDFIGRRLSYPDRTVRGIYGNTTRFREAGAVPKRPSARTGRIVDDMAAVGGIIGRNPDSTIRGVGRSRLYRYTDISICFVYSLIRITEQPTAIYSPAVTIT